MTKRSRTPPEPPREVDAATESDEDYLVRQCRDIEADLEDMRRRMRQGDPVTTAITALRRQLREARTELAALRARRGDRWSPAERMGRARDLARRAPDALLEVYVEEWLARRRIPVSAVAALVEGRE